MGRRPTFELEPVPSRVETFILDFDQDIYGTDISIDFIKRLRDEQKFSSSDELIKQIGIDIEITKRFFEDQE